MCCHLHRHHQQAKEEEVRLKLSQVHHTQPPLGYCPYTLAPGKYTPAISVDYLDTTYFS